MRDVIPEAMELLDEKRVSPDDFRAFSCSNPIRLHGGMNPRFFEGTPVADEARRVLGGSGNGRAQMANGD